MIRYLVCIIIKPIEKRYFSVWTHHFRTAPKGLLGRSRIIEIYLHASIYEHNLSLRNTCSFTVPNFPVHLPLSDQDFTLVAVDGKYYENQKYWTNAIKYKRGSEYKEVCGGQRDQVSLESSFIACCHLRAEAFSSTRRSVGLGVKRWQGMYSQSSWNGGNRNRWGDVFELWC
jgi:hypothetical protein